MTHSPAIDDDGAVLEARAVALARTTDESSQEPVIDVIPFMAGGQMYAAPADGVREVRRLQGVCRLPRAPRELLGIARVRSTAVPVFDVRGLLGLPDPAVMTRPAWIIVLQAAATAPLGLAADHVDGMQQQRLDDIATPDIDGMPGSMGITAHGLIVLDVAALLAAEPVFSPPGATGQYSASQTRSGRYERQM